jgi:hypothetical protein
MNTTLMKERAMGFEPTTFSLGILYSLHNSLISG